jgi:hypothetical protein
MWWECSACGERIWKDRRPTVCTTCGTAGTLFPLTEYRIAVDSPEDGFRQFWIRTGLDPHARFRRPR